MSSDIFTLTKQLIEIPSEQSRSEELFRIVSFVKEYFYGTDFVIREHECNSVPSIVVSNTDSKSFDVVLSGHLDVVPADRSQYIAQEDDMYIYGRGAYDMKSGVAIMMHVLRHLQRTDMSVALMLTTDEETGGFNGTKYLLEHAGYSARVAVIPDGGYKESQIALKEKGIAQIRVSTAGVGAHGSRPWEGDNAIESLMRAITSIQIELEKEKTDDVAHWYTTNTLSTISGGNARNSVPDAAEATFDIRYTESTDIHSLLQRVTDVGDQCGAAVSVLFQEPCVCVSADNVYVRQYIDAMTTCDVVPVLSHDYGASDARFFAAKQIPVILSQPFGDEMHGPHERVNKQSMSVYMSTLNSFLQHFQV